MNGLIKFLTVQLCTRNRRVRNAYFSFRFFWNSFSRRRAIATALRCRQLRLIIGWRSVFDLVWDESKTLMEILPSEIQKKTKDFPFYYRGTKIDPEITWPEFEKLIDDRYPIEIATRFISEESNSFHSLEFLEPTEDDIIHFRDSPLYSFLGSKGIGVSVEFEALSKMLDGNLWKEKTANFPESRLGWNSDDIISIDRGRFSILTYQHLYFSFLIMKFVPTRNNSVVEIGGGFGGLARVLEKMDQELADSYTIIDLPFVGKLQGYFLSKEFGDVVDVNRFVGDDGKKYNLVDIFNLDKISEDSVFDIAIATHSLTELDPEQINEYLERVLFRSTHILLSMQTMFRQNDYDVTWVISRILGEGYICVYRDTSEIYSWTKKRACLTAMFNRI